MSLVLLTYYSLAILVASIFGGMAPRWLRLTHRWMECAVSLVAGVMLGVALLHLLPHALAESIDATSRPDHFAPVMLAVLAGFLVMFFVERFFCFHHHDLPEEREEKNAPFVCHEHDHTHSDHAHDLTWSGAALGLTLHSVLAGVALGASVEHGSGQPGLAGLGVFLAILLHKPFDSMTIAMLMQRGGGSAAALAAVNAAFSLAVPAGSALFYLGFASGHGEGGPLMGAALAFSAGVFLCISMSDLLPELQFHHHDRLKLSAALLIGLAVAIIACQFEQHAHQQPSETPPLTREASSSQTTFQRRVARQFFHQGSNRQSSARLPSPHIRTIFGSNRAMTSTKSC